MEGLREFLSPGYGYGYGDGSGDGDGYGYGSGDDYGYGSGSGYGSGDDYGYGYGDGSGSGYDSGDGSGSGYDSGDGYGYGYGDGSGSGYGDGSGSGYGSGYGYDIKSINGCPVCLIDGVYTVIHQLHGNIAKGSILGGDLSLTPCYVVKRGGIFAHGDTLHEAQEALISKLFDALPEDERIDAFCKEFKNLDAVYPIRTFFEWHHRLTGSCDAGRRAFAKDHELDIENGSMSVREFLELTKNAYGGSTIRKVLERVEGRTDEA